MPANHKQSKLYKIEKIVPFEYLNLQVPRVMYFVGALRRAKDFQ